MILHRHTLLAFVLGVMCALPAGAQDDLGGGGFSDGGASSSFSPAPAPSSSFLSEPAPSPTPDAGSVSEEPFGASATGSQPVPGASSAFGAPPIDTNLEGSTPDDAPAEAPRSSEAPSFSLPGFYGAAPNVFTGGEGRLSRPRFRYNVSASVGYDDNVFQTPTEPFSAPDQQVETVVDFGTPDTVREVPVFETQFRFIEGFPNAPPIPVQVQTGTRQEVVRGRAPRTEVTTIPGIAPQDRVGSFVAQAGAGIDVQFFTRRTLFTFDLNANATNYWSRPGPDPTDYNGSFAISFLHRIAPRLQTTANVSASYLSQPDVGRINAPTQPGQGNYLAFNSKVDLSYRWTPRFSTVASLSHNALLFEEEAARGGNFIDTIFGTEFRYLWTPRFTAVAEGRYSSISYSEAPGRNSTTAFLLLGSDFTYSRRLTGTLRAGYSIRSFEAGGENTSTPYGELAVVYRAGVASVLALSQRVGFEEPDSPTQERLVFRTGLSYRQAFSPRLSAVVSGNYLHEIRTDRGTNFELTQDTFDATIRVNYAVTRRLSLNSYYTFTTLSSSAGFSDYYRNRLFVGGEYVF